MERREFGKLCTGILSGLGLQEMLSENAGAAEQFDRKPQASSASDLGESYLVRGLTGMAKASGWFDAHWGAAVIAGYYLCKENHLDQETVSAIKTQLDVAIKLRGEQFTPLAEQEPNEALIEKVPQALAPTMEGGLRAHGHAVIFASLSTKALRDSPRMAQPNLIDALCGLSRKIGRMGVEKPHDPASATYVDTQAMIEALFDSLARFEPLLGRPSVRRPNFTHMTTHTEALLNLELMGYPELAKAGQVGHSVHISAPVPQFDPKLHPQQTPASLESIMSTDFWEDQDHRDQWRNKFNVTENRNGDWIASGHLFKVLYSYHRLISRIEDKDKVRLCSRILLERYFNPAVEGG